jgi:hypothetical protein
MKHLFQSALSFSTLCLRRLRVKLMFAFVFFARLLMFVLASRCAAADAG